MHRRAPAINTRCKHQYDIEHDDDTVTSVTTITITVTSPVQLPQLSVYNLIKYSSYTCTLYDKGCSPSHSCDLHTKIKILIEIIIMK